MGLTSDRSAIMLCKVWTTVQSYVTIASFMSIHAIVAWRLYALHGGQAWIRRLLWIAAVLYVSSSTVVITVALVPIVADLKPFHHECVSSIPSYLWVAWLPSVFFETLLFGLTVVAMLRQEKRRSFSTLSLLLYRDGMLYFVAVTVCSLFSLLVWALAPPSLIGLARYFALAMVNIAGSRLVLNLKGFKASRSSIDSLSFSIVSSEAALTPAAREVCTTATAEGTGRGGRACVRARRRGPRPRVVLDRAGLPAAGDKAAAPIIQSFVVSPSPSPPLYL
ncbi:hypothetical protein EVJ58_g3947 [Rhodofomes roseus]|uniref:Uncharacterized protein n=1 Tax=Rhodofomes roseus TaxID=34475 RepID=A0A4Y9YIU5_9APHY|nr:hypothetical protein EVJ58_g3947 [Rhodofomes roseus]